MMHQRWPKFQNIHKLVAQGGMDEVQSVVALEKLDGSNLGLEIDPSKPGGIVAIHGRNIILWDAGMKEEPFQRSYGSVKGSLDHITSLIPKLVILAKKLIQEESEAIVAKQGNGDVSEVGPKTIVFFGEWFKVPGQGTKPNWYPFGYGIYSTNVDPDQRYSSFRTMTSERYQMFLDHGLDPPRMLFSGGNIHDLIEALYPTMLEASVSSSSQFEGVFITPETGGTRNCAKWKTGNFEEQTRFVISARKREQLSPEMDHAVDKLYQVFQTKKVEESEKTNVSSKSSKDAVSKELEAIDRQVELALHSVLSKSPVALEDIRAMNHDGIKIELRRLHEETLQDVTETYMASGMEVPKEVKKRVGKIVADHIMRGRAIRNLQEECGEKD